MYCDFHGHSRKSNVFMYGNSTVDPKENKLPIRDFLNERMLPFIISQLVSHYPKACLVLAAMSLLAIISDCTLLI